MLKIFSIFESFTSNSTDDKFRPHKIVALIIFIIVVSFFTYSELQERKLLKEKKYTIIKHDGVYKINILDKRFIGEKGEWYEITDSTNQIKLIHDDDINENLDTKVKLNQFNKILNK
jgi:hypothetical protein